MSGETIFGYVSTVVMLCFVGYLCFYKIGEIQRLTAENKSLRQENTALRNALHDMATKHITRNMDDVRRFIEFGKGMAQKWKKIGFCIAGSVVDGGFNRRKPRSSKAVLFSFGVQYATITSLSVVMGSSVRRSSSENTTDGER